MTPSSTASASAAKAPVILRIGETSDLITANPCAVSAGSDWSVVTALDEVLSPRLRAR